MQRLVLTGLLLLLPVVTQGAAPRLLTAIVQRVSDGDSVTALSANGTTLRLRLLGIDAPEVAYDTKPGQPYGEEARTYLEQLVRGQRIRVQVFGTDRYQRALGLVWVGTRVVNVELVRAGLAEVDCGAPCHAHCRELERAERQARRDRVGMWALGDKYESPGDFRGKRLSGIGPAEASGYVALRQGEGAANDTINRELGVLGRMLRLAYENGKLLRLPMIHKLKEAKPREGFFEREQFESVKRHLHADLQVAVSIAYAFGWRMQSKVLTLKREQVDLNACTIRLEPGTTTNDEGRIVYLTPELHSLLQAQVDQVEMLSLELTPCPSCSHTSEDGTRGTGFKTARRHGRPRASRGCWKVWRVRSGNREGRNY